MHDPKFAYELGATVALSMSGERGKVIGRHEALDHPSQYHVRYVASDGRQVTSWFWASEIAADVSTYDDPNFDPKTQGHL